MHIQEINSDNEEVGDILEKGGNDMQEVHASKYSILLHI